MTSSPNDNNSKGGILGSVKETLNTAKEYLVANSGSSNTTTTTSGNIGSFEADDARQRMEDLVIDGNLHPAPVVTHNSGSYTRDNETVGDKVDKAKEGVKDTFNNLGNKMSEGADKADSHTRNNEGGWFSSSNNNSHKTVGEQVDEAGNKVRNDAHNAKEDFKGKMQENADRADGKTTSSSQGGFFSNIFGGSSNTTNTNSDNRTIGEQLDDAGNKLRDDTHEAKEEVKGKLQEGADKADSHTRGNEGGWFSNSNTRHHETLGDKFDRTGDQLRNKAHNAKEDTKDQFNQSTDYAQDRFAKGEPQTDKTVEDKLYETGQNLHDEVKETKNEFSKFYTDKMHEFGERHTKTDAQMQLDRERQQHSGAENLDDDVHRAGRKVEHKAENAKDSMQQGLDNTRNYIRDTVNDNREDPHKPLTQQVKELTPDSAADAGYTVGKQVDKGLDALTNALEGNFGSDHAQ